MRNFGPLVDLDGVAYIHESVQLFGKVRVGEGASLWPYAVVRAEQHEIEIGPYTNIQDFVMIHIGTFTPTRIGAYCCITHRAVIHGATLGDNCLVGVGAILMDGCVVGENSTIGAGCVLPPNTIIPPHSVVMGVPGKVTKTRNNWVENHFIALQYHANALAYSRGEHRAWDGEEFQLFAMQQMQELREEFARRFPQDQESL